MSNAVAIANRDQGRAVRPGVSVWVTASAGSGKTKVLTERVLALLLAGTPPQRILCLTFTKAAAAQMNNRVNEKLAAWVTMDDGALSSELAPLVGGLMDGATHAQALAIIERARRLFAQVLDAPGGLQISTLHGFCQSLLRRFPLEARVPPHFSLMDDRDTAEALDEALNDTIAHARDGDDESLAGALAVLTARVHEANFADLMSALVVARSKLKRTVDSCGGVDGAIGAMRAKLGLSPLDTEISIIADGCADSMFDGDALRRAAEALARGTKTDQARGSGIAAWLADPTRRAETFERYAELFLTDSGVRSTLATKVVASQPGIAEALQSEAARLVRLVDNIKAARGAEGTAALMRIGDHVLGVYEDGKIRRGLMDYDDLIQLTRHLLARPGIADWVLYKLDGGIDHILIDEAQDTSPDQWAIVKPIHTEFFAGLGRHEDVSQTPRTVFVVGDRKQSIYSFQGAAPEAFDGVHDETKDQVLAAEQRWDDIPMNVSFRSTPAVLAAVNAVFAPGTAARIGVAGIDEDITHLAAREGAAGMVEIWPLVEPQVSDDDVSWKPPVERRKGDSPQSRLAALVATRISRMVDGKELLESQGRPIRPGDIMVLVRRRTDFVEDLVRQLKKLRVAVAGVDRMVLTDQMAIMDLVALGQFLLLPEDDLVLATVLKGPLLALSEDELFTLAYDRGGLHLWDALSAHAGSQTRFGAAHTYLADLMAKTDYLTPAELYGHVLVTLQGRRKLLARLGVEADDPIDEFMNLALAYQKSHPPTLQGFLRWMAAGDVEIKRDLEQSGGDAVRVITVHGAKGLEAPIVFLPDTAQVPTLRNPLLWTNDEIPLLLWAAKADDLDLFTTSVREAAKQAQDREYHRLLYVAMTRAADRLYVCGWQSKRPGKLDDTWYGLIKARIAALPQTQNFTDPSLPPDPALQLGTGLRLATPQTSAPALKSESLDMTSPTPLPPWAAIAPDAEAAPPRPLAPSRAMISDPAALSPLKDDGKLRYQRGIVIHRLLQSLPEIPAARRRAAAEAFVMRPGWELSSQVAAAIVTETLEVLENPSFAPLFTAGSRAEVSLTGLVGVHAIAAQVDRLAVTGTEVWIVDYKTNRPPPHDPAHVAPAYVFQMATYRAALRAIYPHHKVRCVLLWTDGPFTMELSDQQMDEVLLSAAR